MRQTTESVAEITTKFWEKSLLVPQYTGDEEMKKTHYHDMLIADIQKYISYSTCPTLDDMITRAREREREIDIEHIRKRKAEIRQTTGVSRKKPKGFDSRSKGKQGRSRRGKCGKSHEGVFRLGGSG